MAAEGEWSSASPDKADKSPAPWKDWSPSPVSCLALRCAEKLRHPHKGAQLHLRNGRDGPIPSFATFVAFASPFSSTGLRELKKNWELGWFTSLKMSLSNIYHRSILINIVQHIIYIYIIKIYHDHIISNISQKLLHFE